MPGAFPVSHLAFILLLLVCPLILVGGVGRLFKKHWAILITIVISPILLLYQQLKEKLTMEQETTTVEFLISKDDFIIRKVQYTTSSQEIGITHTETLTFFDFNQPITVEPSLDGQGNLLPGWQMVTSYGSQ